MKTNAALSRIVKDREQKGLPVLETLAADLRYSVRIALQRPGFALIVVLSLALGIGANTALFVINHLLLQSLPVKEPDQLVLVQRIMDFGGGRVKPTRSSTDDLEIIAQNSPVFSDVLGFFKLDRPVVRIAGVTESPLLVEYVSNSFFRTLGLPMAIGSSERSNNAPGAVISDRFWHTRFDGDSNVLGRVLDIDGHSYTIAGVAPSQFLGLELESAPDIWLWSNAPATDYDIVGRLKPNVSPEQARIALEALFHSLNRQELGGMRLQTRVTLAGKGLSSLRGQYQRPLLALMVLVSLILLITCTNIGTLLVVRNSARVRELTVRVSLGASRSRLTRQLLVENAVLAAVGGALAVLVARGGVSAILSMLPAAPLALQFHVDWRTLTFVAGVSLFCTLLFALAPAWRATQVNLTAGLKAGPGTTMARDTRWLGRILVAGQVGSSVVLLAGAGLFLQTLRNLSRVDPGFDSKTLLQVLVDTEGSGYQQGQVGNLYRLLIERLTAIPGVRSATGSRNPIMRGPLSGWSHIEQVEVGPQFFETMRIPLLRGRFLTAGDDTAGFRAFPMPGGGVHDLPTVVVISESLAKKLFPGGDAVGQPLPDPLFQHLMIIGVVKNAKFSGLREDVRPPIYVPQGQEPDRFDAIEVRTIGDPSTVAHAVQAEVRRVNPRLLLGVSSMQEEMDRSITQERMVASISAFFSTLGLVLACLGLFGVASYAVAQRTNEMGIRIALGAGRWDVIRESLQETMLVFGAGLIVGVVAATAGVRLAAGAVSELLFGIAATDSLNIAVSALVMIAVAILACVIPARRAATVDPLVAIRCE